MSDDAPEVRYVRDPHCPPEAGVEWGDDGYDPRCCRFPKSCSYRRPITIEPAGDGEIVAGRIIVGDPPAVDPGLVARMAERAEQDARTLEAWEIVRALAAAGPPTEAETSECTLCAATYDEAADAVVHEPSCPWRRAVELVRGEVTDTGRWWLIRDVHGVWSALRVPPEDLVNYRRVVPFIGPYESEAAALEHAASFRDA